jgi:hypothetical protein
MGRFAVADQQLVIGIFENEEAADMAVESLKTLDQGSADIKLGAIGVLVLDDAGQIKEHKLGQRSGHKGAGIGLVLAVIAPPTLLAGVIGGGVIGHFHHKGLGLSQADRERITAELTGGKAAVGVLAPAVDAVPIEAKLKAMGGTAEVHDVSDEALEAVAAAAPNEAEAPLATV